MLREQLNPEPRWARTSVYADDRDTQLEPLFLALSKPTQPTKSPFVPLGPYTRGRMIGGFHPKDQGPDGHLPLRRVGGTPDAHRPVSKLRKHGVYCFFFLLLSAFLTVTVTRRTKRRFPCLPLSPSQANGSLPIPLIRGLSCCPV